jgi:hypothetical protein
MNISRSTSLIKAPGSAWAAVAALTLSLWLFYIDEGLYNFAWMRSWLNWIWLLVYSGWIWAAQMLAGRYLFKQYTTWERVILGILLVTPISAGLLIGLLVLIVKSA